MKKRILSLLLVVCMLVGLLPTTAFAVESDEAAQQFALYMSELGLVDDSGQLIQDNTFTVEDGTKLDSLDALLDWLDACEEDDMDTLITVDATRKTVTADLLLQAISVESQVGMVANTLSLLATDTSTTSASTVDVSAHSLRLVQKISADGDIVTFQVGVSKSVNGDFVPAPHDIQIQSGLFVNRIDNSYDQVAVAGTKYIPVNGYGTATLAKGETYIEYKLDLEKLRYYFNGFDTTYNPWGDGTHVLGENGHWLGYEKALFQSRVFSGAPEQSVQNYFLFAPFFGISEVLTNVRGDYNSGNGNYKVADTTNRAPVVFSFAEGTNYVTTIGDKNYFSFTPSNFTVTDASGDGTSTYPLNNLFKGAWHLGAGDADHSVIIKDAYALLKVDNDDNDEYFAYETYVNVNPEEVVLTPRNFDLYWNEKGILTKAAKGTSLYQYSGTGTKASMAKQIAAAVSGSWYYDETDKDMKAIYDALYNEASADDFANNKGNLDNRRIGLYFSNLKIPTYSSSWFDNPFPTLAFETNSLKTPLTFATDGNIIIADTTAPTVKNIYIQSWDKTFRPGDVIPILVEFSEPVEGNYILYNGTTQIASSSANIENYYGTVTTNNWSTYSNLYVCYYTVQPGDTGIRVSNVSAGQGNSSAMDTSVNYFSNVTFDKPYTFKDCIRKASVKETIDSVSATVDQDDPTQMTVTVGLKDNDLTEQLWGNWKVAAANKKPFTLSVILNGNESTKYSEAVLQQDGISVVYNIDLPALAEGTKDYTVELYVEESDTSTNAKYYGAYATCTQKAIVKADENAYTISADQWPSGTDNVVFKQDQTYPIFSAATGTQTDHTYKGTDQFYWKSSDESVFTVSYQGTVNNLQSASTVTIAPKKEGTATLTLWSKNGGSVGESQASNAIEITVKDDKRPTLLLPSNANTFFARKDTDLTFSFTSNLGTEYSDGDDSRITWTLYELSENGEPTALWTDKLTRDKTEVTVPGKYLTTISKGDTPGYRVTLTSTASYYGETRPLSTDAYIVVRSQPAKVTLPWTKAPLLTSDKTLGITWTLDNWDTTNLATCGFDFRVEKNGEIFKDSHITDVSEETSGSYTLVPDTPSGLKDEYVVMVKAKNASDPTWSTASVIVTVYRSGALDLVVGGKKVDEITLKNQVAETATSTDPSITNYDGTTFDGLTSAQAIAALRGQLGLMESISINYGDYDWNYVNDMFQWSTTESAQNANITDTAKKLQEIVSINYRQGSYYEPLENFSYLYYIPKALMMLCGLSEGSTTVTAQHASLPSLSSSVTVNVEMLKNKLYLFQFTPAVQTTVSYEDGKGNTHTVVSNSDGSLALYEPNGIASDLRCASTEDGKIYRGTASMLGDTYNVNLKSGEGNGVFDELYPLNAVELRPAASMELTIFKPDGTPLSNANVTLRGGVYRNLDQVTDASQRDTAYCYDAKFSKTSTGTASLDGKVDQVFKTDDNGVLQVYMDSTQFFSQQDPSNKLDQNDLFRFVFELRFENDEYQPELVEFDTQMTHADVVRSGGNLLTLTAASEVKPVIATQTVDYYTGREINVRRHTGVVGPSADYTTVRLSTRLMLWGMEQVSTQDTGYSFDVRAQETAVKLSGQTHANAHTASYPFSSIPLLENVTLISTDSFGDFKATTRIPMELVLYNGSGAMERTLTLSFGLIDMTAVEKVSESESVIGLMSRLTLAGSSVYPKLDNTVLKIADDLIDALSLLEGVGAKLGLIRTVLMPTEDPTIFSAYVWTGYDTTLMSDLRYDERGVYVEPAHVVQDLEQVSFAGFTVGDYKAMSDGTYFERLQEDNTALATRLFGTGKVMQGWMTAEICYNFDEGRWEVLTTGGAMRFGKEIELAIVKQRFKPILYNYSVTLRGGLVVTLETAIRYAEALGSGQGTTEMIQAINDYLTSIRVNAFIELYGGLGIDKYGIAFTAGAYGDVELNTESLILSRGDESDSSYGDFVQLDGKIGLREKIGVGSMVLKFDLVSITVGDQWPLRKWDEITESWANNQSGYKTGWIDGKNTQISPYSTQSLDRQVVVATSGGEVRVQSREYLEEGDRIWLGGDSGISLMSLDNPNKLKAIETNSYPFSMPMILDDGGMLVYLSDADSTDVEDVEVRYSLADGGSFPDGTAISSPAGFDGYGDSDLDLDGDRGHAAAIWLRQSAHLDLSPNAIVTQEQQLALTRGLEVVASIWNGSEWATTRLTENATQELTPIIAISADGSKAVAAWRSVQQGDSLLTFTENRILFKIYKNGNWSQETYTLYNGSSGSVSSMSIEMINDTALVAYTVEDTDDGAADTEIYYALVNTGTAGNAEDAVKTVRVTTNDYTDADPQLTTAGDRFVLGWYREPDDQGDIGLLTIDTNGAPHNDLPASLSDMVSTESFNGKFAFVKGADSLDELSLLWDDANTGDADNDVIRAIKFSNFGSVEEPSYGASAAVEVAALLDNTHLNSIDAYTERGTDVRAVLQGTTYSEIIADDPNTEVEEEDDPTTYEEVEYTYTVNGEEQTFTAMVPKETVNLFSASETYADKVEVIGTNVDYTTLAANSYIPVTFTVSNQGIHAIDSISVTLGGQTQTFSGQTLLPGRSKALSVVVKTGSVIDDLGYTVTAGFRDGETKTATGTVHLDYPDVGISTLTVTGEQDGHRTFLATLYNQSAAALNKSGRRVVLGVYTDPSCSTRINGKYFEDGTADTGYEVTINGSEDLSRIDSAGFAKELDFNIASYMEDAGLTEIPDSGVTLFVKARVERHLPDGSWAEMPEADTQNNQKSITFHSLLARSGNASVTTSVELTNANGTSAANVQLRSHTLQPSSSGGYLLAALLDNSGQLLETQSIGNVSLACEEIRTIPVAFSQSGSRVVLRYGEAESGGSSFSNANAASITIDGLPLTIGSFDENDSAVVENVSPGQYLLTVIPEGGGATVTVNGEPAENRMMAISGGYVLRTVTVTITAADDSTTRTYTIYLTPDPSQASGSDYYTLNFETNGGSKISALQKKSGATVDLTASTPTRSGYIFTGWYADKALTEKITKVTLTGNITVYAGWQEAAASSFSDIPKGSYYEEAVNWAVEQGITAGTSATTFSPDATCTRAQAVTFLWRAAGSPAPQSHAMSFTDVAEGSYYHDAVLWAVENGVTAGTSATTFSPDAKCTRAQIVTFLWRAQESPVADRVNPFTDVAADAYYNSAVVWAVEKEITAGTSATTFSPDSDCTRAQIVTFLYRCMK
ncbi:S-layer homology domain-containing protein [Pseudoflavonifractor phocaeensis]|uniref:S-layer homology domain-containing protein n=1 Tax=Pseudoflavonifractor phocaeensis TaxID=1870988 RepID=UPI001F1D9707|nr:S-layer homology domain-containing protein [Pseudoflavonifractor phocaeensis]MCF2660845.1 S-layer homology domain-containing protein [Pseudoflavonifractor phocaeensis]